jgi:phage recombination protein Bet
MTDHSTDLAMRLTERRPIIDVLEETDAGQRTLALLKSTVALKATNAEVGMFLELCQHYGLDPFAKEAWCAVSDKGARKVLIMVGRDGLRKIAMRQGFQVDGDVVRKGDEFTVEREPGKGPVVRHVYAPVETRKEIVGAWALATDMHGRSRGFFYAPLEEYKPKSASEYSPWSKQASVMILAAAERQAIRMATPLGGLLVVGEDESTFAQQTVGEDEGKPTGAPLLPEVVDVVQRAKLLGHARYADLGVAEMATVGQPRDRVMQWVARASAELDRVEGPAEVPDAVVVPEGNPYPTGEADEVSGVPDVPLVSEEEMAEAQAALDLESDDA